MNRLSESQTNLIVKWVKSHHLTIRSLENEFIDHICCDVENLMNEGTSFKVAFENLQKEMGEELLSGLEKQTILQLTFNERIMKFMTRLAGIIVLFSFLSAIVCRIIGIEFWKTLMAGGMLILAFGFTPLFFINHYQRQEGQSQKVLHIFGFLAALLVPLSAFMGLLNSPHALAVMGIGILFLIFGFIPLSWLSASKGSDRSAITGSIIFLLFFVLIAYGFLGVKISKDRLNNWIFFSRSADQSAIEIKRVASYYFQYIKEEHETFALASEVVDKSDILVQKLTGLRDDFILRVSKSYKPGDMFFKGMDSHYAGKKLLINSKVADQILKETAEYEGWLISILSEDNEVLKQKIGRLLNADFSGEHPDYVSQKNYLFRDFPAIADVSVINSMILNVRIAEYQTLKFLKGKFPTNSYIIQQ